MKNYKMSEEMDIVANIYIKNMENYFSDIISWIPDDFIKQAVGGQIVAHALNKIVQLTFRQPENLHTNLIQ